MPRTSRSNPNAFQGPPPRPNRRNGLAVGQPSKLPSGLEWVWRLGSYTPVVALRCLGCGDVLHTSIPIGQVKCPGCNQAKAYFRGKAYKALKDLPKELVLKQIVYLPFEGSWFAAHPDLLAELLRLEGVLESPRDKPSYELRLLVSKYRQRKPDFMDFHEIYDELNHVPSQVPRQNLPSDPSV